MLADDVKIGSSEIEVLIEARERYKELLGEIGLKLSDKPGCSTLLPARGATAATVGNIPTEIKVVEGQTFAGVPCGSDQYIHDQMREKAEAVCKELERMRELPKQVAYILLYTHRTLLHTRHTLPVV